MNLKQMVGIEAAEYVENGMIIGLSIDSTAKFVVDEIGCRVKEEGLSVVGVTISKETEKQTLALGIPLKGIDEVPYVDPTIDGADKISADFQGIKDGGAALPFEKIMATYSKKCIWIMDKSKMVDDLEAFPLPVEAVSYDSCQLVHLFEEKGYHPALRLNAAGEMLITDEDHRTIDLHLEEIADSEALGSYLDSSVGVVEHGLFLNMVSVVVISYEDGPRTLHAPAH